MFDGFDEIDVFGRFEMAWAEVQRGDLTARLIELDPHLRWLASVCTSGMVLAHAGLLRAGPPTPTAAASRISARTSER